MNVALIGYGRMGREIEAILLSRGDTVGLIIDKENSDDISPEKIVGIDVAIEFSTPESAYDNIVKLLRCGVPVVCGTTAWLGRFDEIKSLCEIIV